MPHSRFYTLRFFSALYFLRLSLSSIHPSCFPERNNACSRVKANLRIMSSHPVNNQETTYHHQYHQYHSDANYIDPTAYNLFYYAHPDETKGIMEQAKRVEELDKKLTKLKQVYDRYILNLPEKSSLKDRAGAWLRPSRSASPTLGSAHPSQRQPAIAEPFAQLAANSTKIQLEETEGIYDEASKSLAHQLRSFAHRATVTEEEHRDLHHTAQKHILAHTAQFDPDNVVLKEDGAGEFSRANRSHATIHPESTHRSLFRGTHGHERPQGPDTSFGLVEEARALARDCSDPMNGRQALEIMKDHGAYAHTPILHHRMPIPPSARFDGHHYRIT